MNTIHTMQCHMTGLTLAFLVLAERGNLEPAVVVGRTSGDCSTLRSLEGAVAAKGEAAARLAGGTIGDASHTQGGKGRCLTW